MIRDNGQPVFKKAELIRVPLRLGEDAFLKGRITKIKTEKLITAMKAFRNLIDVYDAAAYHACATAAMREAENRWEIIHRIRKEAGIKVELISGKTEAGIIFSNHVEERLDKKKSYLYIDIGGGSTELTLFSKGKCLSSQSFNIGTIRLLHDKVEKEYWNYFKQWIRDMNKGDQPLVAIGSGGNINKLYKMAEKKEDKALSYKKLKQLAEVIESYPVEDRMKLLGLNPDRADVIVPAAKIALTVMKNAGIDKMIVPQIGLSDGIVHRLYEEHSKKKKTSISLA